MIARNQDRRNNMISDILKILNRKFTNAKFAGIFMKDYYQIGALFYLYGKECRYVYRFDSRITNIKKISKNIEINFLKKRNELKSLICSQQKSKES
jgi:hypothetical protein